MQFIVYHDDKIGELMFNFLFCFEEDHILENKKPRYLIFFHLFSETKVDIALWKLISAGCCENSVNVAVYFFYEDSSKKVLSEVSTSDNWTPHK